MSKMITKSKIIKWLQASAKLQHYKAIEAELRKEIADAILEGKATGVHHDYRLGYHIKATKKTNISVDELALAAIWNDLSEAEKDSIKYKPSLVSKNYKKLDDSSMLDHCIIAKPGMPGLEITLIEEE